MNSRLLIVDGHNLLFQMFFGMPSRIVNKDGIAIQGVIGFVGALRKLISIFKPTHAVVLFDCETHNPRHDISDEYKANRPDFSTIPDEENPFSQLPYIYEALDFMKIKHTEVKNAETDDVIASYALSVKDDTDIYISSFDSDYFQLIRENIKVIRYRGENSTVCDEKYINAKFGITPGLYADFKSLVGDTSDNIKGVRGIGPKTAAKLINSYGSLDSICKNPGAICEEKLKNSICENVDILRRNYSLIKLDTHAQIPFPFNELILPETKYQTMEIIKSIGL